VTAEGFAMMLEYNVKMVPYEVYPDESKATTTTILPMIVTPPSPPP